MKYYRLGHLEPNIKVKVGDKVEVGQLVGYNGTGNGQWPAHTHYDILTYRPGNWTDYVIGKSIDYVKSHYANPHGLEKVVMPTFDHYGYDWLDKARYAGGSAYHPGIDLNGKGSGDMDKGDTIHSPCDGIVVYIYNGSGPNHGWGPLLVIKELNEEPMKKEFVKAVEHATGQEYGDNLNDNEQKDAAKRLNDLVDLVEEMKLVISNVSALTDELEACRNQPPKTIEVVKTIEKPVVKTVTNTVYRGLQEATVAELVRMAILKFLGKN